MKFSKIILITGLTIAILTTAGLWGYNVLKYKSKIKEAKTMVHALGTSAQASYDELEHYPRTFKAMGFAPIGTSHVTLSYKSTGQTCIATATLTEPRYALTTGSHIPTVEKDLLANDAGAVRLPANAH